LNLAGALAIQLPDALTAKSSTKLTQSGKKSMEACLLRESAKQSTQMLEGISTTLCHIEAESANVEEGKPVLFKIAGMGLRLQDPNMQFPGGDTSEMDPNAFPSPSMTPDPSAGPTAGGPSAGGPAGGGDRYVGVYVKKFGEAGKEGMNVFVCEGDSASDLKLSQHFKILGSKKITKDGKEVGASKGEMRITQDMMGVKFGAFVTYDNYFTDAKTSDTELRVRIVGEFDMTGAGLQSPSMPSMKMDMAQLMAIKATDSGVTRVAISDRGDMMGFITKNTARGKFDSTHGRIMGSFETSGQGDDGLNSKTDACVDNDSNLVSCDNSKYKPGGSLFIAPEEVPKLLSEGFKAPAPKGFDCATAEWGTAKSVDATSTAHSKCDMEQGDVEAPSCFSGDDYQAAESPEGFDPNAIPNFGELPEIEETDLTSIEPAVDPVTEDLE
jgi:hypothetical protein